MGEMARDTLLNKPLSPTLRWGFAALTGVCFGLLEGVVYQHPRISVWGYWTILGAVQFAFLSGWLGALRAGALFPFVVVVQDALSLVSQGSTIQGATWYVDYFGDNVLTAQTPLGAPGFYFIATALSLALDVLLSWRASVPAAPRRGGGWRVGGGVVHRAHASAGAPSQADSPRAGRSEKEPSHSK